MTVPTVGMTFGQRAIQRGLASLAMAEFVLCIADLDFMKPWGVWVVSILLVVTLAALIRWRWGLAPHMVTNIRDPAGVDDEQTALDLMNRVWGRDLSGRRPRIKRLIRMLVSPGVLGRVTEYVDLTAETFDRQIETSWMLPESIVTPDEQSWLPVFTPIKGTLVDRLEVYGGSGDKLPLLPVREVHTICLMSWKFLVGRLLSGSTLPPAAKDVAARRLFDLGGKIILQTMRPEDRDSPQAHERLARQAISSLRAELQATQVAATPQRIAVASRFLATLSARFVVMAAVPIDRKNIVVRHTHRLEIPRRSESSTATGNAGSVRRHILNPLKRLVGKDSPLIVYDVSLSRLASSYHFELLVPRQNYVAIAVLEDSYKRSVVRPPRAAYAVERWYFRFSRLGRRTSHFYARGLGNFSRPLQLVVRVSELPWASLFRAFVFSVLATGCMGLTASAVKFGGPEASTVALGLVGLPFTLGVAWLTLFPANSRVATAAMSVYLTLATLLLLAWNGLACSGTLNGWHHWWAGQEALDASFRMSAGITVIAGTTLATRVGVWRRTYARAEA